MVGAQSVFCRSRRAALVAAVISAGFGSAQESPWSSSVLSPDEQGYISSFPVDWDRPATVPKDFVVTPNGYFHPSCVIAVHEDEMVRGYVIERADGARRHVSPCAYPHYDRRGNAVFSDLSAPTANGWVARADDFLPPVEWLSATWAVPGAPPSNAGQTVYLFPGLEPAATGDTILQPVLAWNGLYAPAGWAIYSWNCCRGGNYLHSDAVAVGAGETISGYAWGSNCDAVTGVCGTWQVRTSSTYSSSTLDTDAYGQVLDWVFGGALEVYNLNACNQYPAGSNVTYQNVTVNRVGGVNVVPVWGTVITPGVTPDCVTAVEASAGTVSISWCTPLTPSQACGSSICGTASDGCGGTVSCGTCGAKQFCGSGGYCYCSYPYRNCGEPVPARPQCYRICP